MKKLPPVLIFVVLTGAGARANVINPGTTNWLGAASTGRADMLVIGDSTVVHNGNGWDAGLNLAVQNTAGIGIAGSGLQVGGIGEGEQYVIGTQYGTTLSNNFGSSAAPVGYAGYVWRGGVDSGTYDSQGNPQPTGTLLVSMTTEAPQPQQGENVVVYTATAPGGGSVGGFVRYGQPPFSVLQTLPTVALANPTTGLGKAVFTINPAPDPTLGREVQINGLTNASILYSRVVIPGATGATVTSWGYGGRGTLDFRNDQYLNGGLTQAGRQTFLNSMVDGGSGKLNVVITEGFNDRNEFSQVSADGVNVSSAPAGFAANMRALMAAVRGDWVAGGNRASDLSFTLLGEYQDYYASSNMPGDILRQYAAQEALIAGSDPQVSFVDLNNIAPDYNTAVADGYMYDQVHFSREGAIVYSQGVMNALEVPEPAGATVVAAVAALGLLARLPRRSPWGR